MTHQVTDHIIPDDGITTLPVGAQLLNVSKRGHRFILSVLADDEQPTEQRRIIRVDVADTLTTPDAPYIGCHCPHFFFDGGTL